MVAAVTIQAVHKHYPSVHALQGVDFQIEQGEFFGLLGLNGAGKSTLINVMAGLTRADQGSVQILGHDVISDWRQARQALGVVPQELVYDPFFTVAEVLHLQSGYFGCGPDNRSWIDELLHTLNLQDKADTNLHELSGGMKRRVLIAQALVHRPQVVVLDEPTAGVDVGLRKALWSFIRRLHNDGHTIVLTTHYLEEAEMLCDRIAILDHGRLLAIDSKTTLLNRYPFCFAILTLQDSATSIPSELKSKVVAYSGDKLTMRLEKSRDNVSDILSTLKSAGITVTNVSTEEPSLEDVFIYLTGHASGNAQAENP